jgi:predicted acetyltransferase
VPRALEARRYLSDVDVIIKVEDELLPRNAGSIRLEAGPEGASVTRTRRSPNLIMNVRELSAIYLAGTPLLALARAGLVAERSKGAVGATAAAFGWVQPPYCPDFF